MNTGAHKKIMWKRWNMNVSFCHLGLHRCRLCMKPYVLVTRISSPRQNNPERQADQALLFPFRDDKTEKPKDDCPGLYAYALLVHAHWLKSTLSLIFGYFNTVYTVCWADSLWASRCCFITLFPSHPFLLPTSFTHQFELDFSLFFIKRFKKKKKTLYLEFLESWRNKRKGKE